MPAPSTAYATASATNPSSALTDFTLIVDLSTMPAAWWSLVDTADGTKGRAYKNDGTTELPVDWIDFDSGAQTGWARIKWSGTLATSGSQVVRLYPSVAANASVAAGDTYGAEAAYASAIRGYWPHGGGVDRTANSNDTASTGTPTVGGQKIGNGTDLDLGDYYRIAHSAAISLSATIAVGGWFNVDSVATDVNAMLACKRTGGGGAQSSWDMIRNSSTIAFRVQSASGQHIARSNADVPIGEWHHWVGVYDGSAVRVYRDGIEQTITAALTGNFNINPSQMWVGAGNDGSNNLVGTTRFDGKVDETFISTGQSAAWVAHEFSQTNDNAAFWGTWVMSATGNRRRRLLCGAAAA